MALGTELLERRSAKRILARDEFFTEFKPGKRQILETALGCDISTTGIRFSSMATLKKGQILEMVLCFSSDFPGTKRLPIKIRIVRTYYREGSRRRRVGCKFESLEHHAQETLAQFVDWMESRQAQNSLSDSSYCE